MCRNKPEVTRAIALFGEHSFLCFKKGPSILRYAEAIKPTIGSSFEIEDKCPIQKLETAATVIQDLKRELHTCMMENIGKLTGKEIETVIFVIHLIYSGDSEMVSGNIAVVGIFREVLGKLLRANVYNSC